MSWWVYLKDADGDAPFAEWNLTYNYTPMLALCSAFPRGNLNVLHGASAVAAEELVRLLRTDMEHRAAEYRRKEPANGWGTFEDLYAWCGKFILACLARSDAKIYIS